MNDKELILLVLIGVLCIVLGILVLVLQLRMRQLITARTALGASRDVMSRSRRRNKDLIELLDSLYEITAASPIIGQESLTGLPTNPTEVQDVVFSHNRIVGILACYHKSYLPVLATDGT